MLPGIITQRTSGHGEQWQTRVVPNKFPALTPEIGVARPSDGFYTAMPGYGKHEVIIESPRHDQDLHNLSIKEIGVVVNTYQSRYKALLKDPKIKHVILFRNHGVRAGTSLAHPHSQLIALGLLPTNIRKRHKVAEEYHDDYGRCLYCALVAHEANMRERVILENNSFLGFVPYAAEVPFEIWVLPKKHQADFGELSEGGVKDFSEALKIALTGLDSKPGGPDYNYVINTTSRSHLNSEHMHWFLQIRPRITTPAGFEIGSGMQINPSLPEQDAANLRGDSN
jgi:UDPglucose--hexose-1-phosphate uridylyltransferase